jgi:hypothetical protein
MVLVDGIPANVRLDSDVKQVARSRHTSMSLAPSLFLVSALSRQRTFLGLAHA